MTTDVDASEVGVAPDRSGTASSTTAPPAERAVAQPQRPDGLAGRLRRFARWLFDPRHRIRPPLIFELAIIAVLLWGYDVIEGISPARHDAAFRHGTDLLHAEGWAHLDPEHALNRALADGSQVIEYVANYYYAVFHFALTLVVLGWLYIRRPTHYPFWRTVLVFVNAIGLVVFWLYPLAPPRLLDAGFVDTVTAGHTLGSWGSPATSSANVFAAMPSLHVAWALWCALAVGAAAHRRWVRWAALIYPALTTLVVMATANHYLFDAIAGALTTVASVVVTVAGRRMLARWRSRRAALADSAQVGAGSSA